MKFKLQSGEIVESTLVSSTAEGTAYWQTYRVPDGRVFSGYDDRLRTWAHDEGGVLSERSVRLEPV